MVPRQRGETSKSVFGMRLRAVSFIVGCLCVLRGTSAASSVDRTQRALSAARSSDGLLIEREVTDTIEEAAAARAAPPRAAAAMVRIAQSFSAHSDRPSCMTDISILHAVSRVNSESACSRPAGRQSGSY